MENKPQFITRRNFLKGAAFATMATVWNYLILITDQVMGLLESEVTQEEQEKDL